MNGVKTPSTKALFLALLLVLGMVVFPVCADTSIMTTGYFPNAEREFEGSGLYDFSYSVNSSYAISNIQFQAPKGTELNYTITYGSGNSLSGYITYLAGDVDFYGYGEGVTTINIGSSTDSRSFVDTGLIPKWEIVGYAREQDNNGTVVSVGYAIYDVSAIGFQTGFIAYESVPNVYPIESITFTSNMPVWLYIGTAERTEIQEGISKTLLDTANEWIQLAIDLGSFVYETVMSLFYWLRFFFWDNLGMTLALYLTLTMVFAARASRGNMARFLRQFIRDQLNFARAILGLWGTLVSILSNFRGIFRL